MGGVSKYVNFPPITLFTYARLDHTQRTVAALLRNFGAQEHDLIIYSDAPRDSKRIEDVAAVRDFLKTIKGFRSVTINYRPHNFGLANSIIDGVTEVLEKYDRIIVLEDDMVTSPYFLTYMNDALNHFVDDDRVISVHGYVYPVQQELPEAFFLRGADCWGWATWRRGWAIFNSDGRVLLDELKNKNLINNFNFNGEYLYSKMLESQIRGNNDSWAIRWYASAFLADKLTLYPGRSLVHNIGNDSSGTHCGSSYAFDTTLSRSPINLKGIEIKSSEIGFLAFEQFFRQTKVSLFSKVSHLFRRALRKVFT
jgi:hypothetical protein